MIGKLIGNCKITEKIGIGGFGTVYKGVQLSLNREVAIKVLHPQYTELPGFVERFQSEAQILASLNHQNIVQVYDIARQEETYYIIMEFVKGETLNEILKIKKKLPLDEALKITEDVAGALTYTHSKNIIHRDIKPNNILITEDKIAKVMDFGIAKVLSETSESFTRIGTLAYASPEQINGEAVDCRADIYGLAATFYHMVCGQPPATSGEITPPSLLNLAITEELNKAVMKALEKKKDDRYRTMEEFITALVASVGKQQKITSVSKEIRDDKTVVMAKGSGAINPAPARRGGVYGARLQLLKKPVVLSTIALTVIIVLFSFAFKKSGRTTAKEETLQIQQEKPLLKPSPLEKPAISEKDIELSHQHYQQGLVYSGREEWIEAIKELTEAVRYNPGNDRAHFELGFAYFHLNGRASEAETHIKKAIELNPQNAMYHYNLGLMYIENEKKLRAIEEWNKALTLDPDNPTIQAILKRYQE